MREGLRHLKNCPSWDLLYKEFPYRGSSSVCASAKRPARCSIHILVVAWLPEQCTEDLLEPRQLVILEVLAVMQLQLVRHNVAQ